MRGLLILFLLLVPSVSAYHLSSFEDPQPGETVDVRQRTLATFTNNRLNGAAGNVLVHTFPWDPEYSFEDKSHTIRVRITYTASFANTQIGTWRLNVAKETTGNLANCAITYPTNNPQGITLDGLIVYPYYQWECLFTQSTNVHYHYHTIWVNRTVDSGTPNAILSESTSVVLLSEDVVITSLIEPTYLEALTGATAFELFILFGLTIACILIWHRSQDDLVPYLMGILLLLVGLIWLGLFLETGSRIVFVFAIFTGLLALYLMIRTTIDGFMERKAKATGKPPG